MDYKAWPDWFPIKRWFSLIASILFLTTSLSAQDLDTLSARLYAGFQGSGGSAATIRQWLASLKPDGTWPDINYADSGSATWAPSTHLSRMQTMAQAYRNPANALYDSASVKNGFLLAFDAWIRLDPQSPNWWWNQIGAQLSLGPAMLLMKDQLSPARLDSGDVLLARSWAAHSTMTGENLVWVSKITIWRGCIMDTASLITDAVSAIVAEIRITTQPSDDIQEDWSFHQHGPQIYSGGYGMGYSSDAADMAQLCRGTQWAFPQDKIDLLSHYILDGQQWMMRGTTMDHSVCGREITRPNSPNKKSAFQSICADMIVAGASRNSELMNFSNRLAAWPAWQGAVLSGNRHFWCSDYMAHQRRAYMSSVKMSSKRTRGAELVNGEGLKSFYCGDGVTFFYRTGLEYYSIFPVWDWTRLPGVTCRHDTVPPAMPASYTGATDFVGGVSDGAIGAAAFDYSRSGVTGRKAWFFFDKEIVALGSAVTAAAGKTVCTSINQCFANGPVVARTGAGTSTLSQGTHRLTAVSWVHHDSIGYFFPAAADSLFVRNDAQTGSWQSINATGSAAPVTDTVFSVWLDHGTAPANASYSYGVIPGIGADSLDSYVKSGIPCKVLSNTSSLQAVRNKLLGASGAVFYSAGSIALTDSMTLAVDRACAVLVRESKDSIEIAVSNPVNTACTVQVASSLRLYGNGASWNAQTSTANMPFVLPGGLDAGESVVMTFGKSPTAAGPLTTKIGSRTTKIRFEQGKVIVDFGTGSAGQLTGRRTVSIFNAAGKQIYRAELADRAGDKMAILIPEKTTGVVLVRVEGNGVVKQRAGVVVR
jgi:chondroitin AC lyase